jgi:1,2-diacylglycerol 3-alpha-glucosyltransferase
MAQLSLISDSNVYSAGRSNLDKVAIACSGLGHIRRGNETWAQTVAEGLYARGGRVSLLGGGSFTAAQCPYTRMWNLPREQWVTRRFLSWQRRYLIEQLTSAAFVIRYVNKHKLDILHVPDPDLALQVHKRTQGTGLRVIFKDGQFLGPHYCSRFRYVQVLAPYYMDLAKREGIDTTGWFVVPHLVNTRLFQPAANQAAARNSLGASAPAEDAFVVLAVGDFSPSSNKRLRWIVEEFSKLDCGTPACLLLAGQASDTEFVRFSREAKAILGDRVRLFCNLSNPEMIQLYQSADVLAHAALREPFGIVLLESMACGVPVVGHRFPVTEWILGDAGCAINMENPGELAATLKLWKDEPALRLAASQRARKRAVSVFADDRILPLYEEMYHDILADREPAS